MAPTASERDAWRASRLFVVATMGVLLGCFGSVADEATIPSDVATPELDGRYVLDDSTSLPELRAFVRRDTTPARKVMGASVLRMQLDGFRNLKVDHGVLHMGKLVIQEISLKDARRAGDTLFATGTVHEDMHDPGDMWDTNVRLIRSANRLQLVMSDSGQTPQTLFYTRAPYR
jgi:hypothetical protein